MTSRLVFLTRFGSDLYGTTRSESDADYRGVYMPSARQILLQSVEETNKDAPVGYEHTDYAASSMHHFVRMVAAGEPNHIDIAFAPEEYWVKDMMVGDEWDRFVENRHHFITRDISKFYGYCHTVVQAYSIRADRHETARRALEIIEAGIVYYGGKSRAEKVFEQIRQLDARFVKTEIQADGVEVLYVCGSGVQATQNLGKFHEQMIALNRTYGRRAERAATTDKKDYKALHHAVRIAETGVELLETGNVVFPRPNAEYLLTIKQETANYEATVEHLVATNEKMLALRETSSLAEKVSDNLVDDFIADMYGKVVAKG